MTVRKTGDSLASSASGSDLLSDEQLERCLPSGPQLLHVVVLQSVYPIRVRAP